MRHSRPVLIALIFLLSACQNALAGSDDSLKIFESLQKRIGAVAKEVTPGVVYIEAILKSQNRKSQVSGSGIIASKDGYIFTNEHVVDSAIKVTVKISDIKDPFPADIVGTDKQTDLAILKIDPRSYQIKPLKFGKSADLEVGQWVLAVGNPFGFDNSVSFGIVQAKGRNLQYRGLINEFIQTDALIDQGSSGGPLVNLRGEVVGINSIAAGRGMGFTIPIETALEVKRNVITSGTVERAWLGITFQPLTRELAHYWNLGTQGGAIVSAVIEGSPAQKAGLAAGDIITKIDNKDVDVSDETESSTLTRLVADLEVGRAVPVEILREGKKKSLQVKLDAQPAVDAPEKDSEWGFGYQDITTARQLAARLDSADGVYVSFVDRGSPADEGGLEVGDVIVSIEGKGVKSAADLAKLLPEPSAQEKVLLTTRRGKDIRFNLLERAPGAHPAATEAESATGAGSGDTAP